MAEAIQVEGDRGPHGWTGRDMPATEQALHAIGVGTVAWSAAVPLMSHPDGLWVAMGMFALAGLIPAAILNWNMLRSLIMDEEMAKCKEHIRIMEERGKERDERDMEKDERIRVLEENGREEDERIRVLEENGREEDERFEKLEKNNRNLEARNATLEGRMDEFEAIVMRNGLA